MITPYLERAVLLGKAVTRSHSFGFSQLGLIKVPEHKICIITDFYYSPFLPRFLKGHESVAEKRFTILQIDCNKAVHNFLMRNYYSTRAAAQGRFFYDPLGTPYHQDCYIVCDNNIKVRLAGITEIDGANFATGAPEQPVNEPSDPLGFQGLNIVKSYRLIAGEPMFYCPQSVEFGKAGNRDQPYVNFAGSSNVKLGDQIPAINFNLVYLDQDYTEKLQPNK